MTTMRRCLLLFVKHPTPGRVKTRIAETTGPARATEIYRALVTRVCAALPPEIPVIVHYDPPQDGEAVRRWLTPLLPQAGGWVAQGPGDLGARLRQAFAAAFAAGWQEVAVIGSDCVEITPAIFDETWQALEKHDAVIGPSDDGGYYLLALRTEQPELFENVRWSTEHTLADTLSRGRHLQFHQLPTLSDVDSEADWLRVRRKIAP
jgi:uncharacterized protein